MGDIQGYNKRNRSTTLRVFHKDRDQVELVWNGSKFLIFYNQKYLRDLTYNVAIESSSISTYDSNEEYTAGETFVTYINESSPTTIYQSEAIYRCSVDALAGESPEIAQTKWVYQGATASEVTIDDVQDLRQELESRIQYTDLSDDFSVDGNTKEVSLNIDYITVTNYSPAEDIQPDPEEVSFNNLIWATSNSDWTDGGAGIVSVDNNAANDAIYGKLYNTAAVTRLLAANSGYRLPTRDEINSIKNNFSGDYVSDNTVPWETRGTLESFSPLWTEQAGLNLVPAGYYRDYGGFTGFGAKGSYSNLWRTKLSYEDSLTYGWAYLTSPWDLTQTGAGQDPYIIIITPSTNSSTTIDPEMYYSVRLIKDI